MGLFTILFVFFCVLYIVYLVISRLNSFRVFANSGIPGPCPNFFVGNMHEMMGPGNLVTDVMSDWDSKYGPFYGYFRGTRATLVVRDQEAIKDILVRNSANFINRPHMVMDVPPVGETVVGLRNERWKTVRQALSPALSSAKIKQMLPLMAENVKTTKRILEEKFLELNSDDQVVDAHKLFQRLACDIICACALAMKTNSQRNQHDRFFIAVTEFLENAMGPFVRAALCVPTLAKVMSWGLTTFGYSHEMTAMITSSVRSEMRARRDQQEINGNVKIGSLPYPARDALQLMMESQQETNAMTDDEVVANAWVFILGGFETTSSCLSYTCYLLSIYQDIQEKLFLEMKTAFELNEVPSYEKLNDLTYLDQVLCESLRLFPPVVNFVIRGLEKDSWIGPYFVPKHVGIQIPVWQIHHDADIWDEPYVFDPSRFDNNAKKVYSNNMQWIPFGNGPRNCLGSRFAMLNMKFVLCSILRRFRVVPSSIYEPHKLKLKVPSVTIVPDGGIPLRFIPRDD